MTRMAQYWMCRVCGMTKERDRTSHSEQGVPCEGTYYVLAADAGAAIAAAEQRGRDRERAEMAKPLDALLTFAEGAQSSAFAAGLVQGQRDMLAQCIAAVESLGHVTDCMWSHDEGAPCPHEDSVGVLRGLEEQP